MKDFTAKELENLFSKKQLSAYNQKLKRELYLLKMDYHKVLVTRDSYIEKEINKREHDLQKEWKHKIKIVELKAKISMDLLNRKEKKIRTIELIHQKELEEKDALIEAKDIELEKKDILIEAKDAEILRLQKELEKRDILLNSNGTNSSTPTSQTSIRMKKVIPNSREKSEKNKGGQIGHKKHKLEKFKDEEITEIRYEELEECTQCHQKHLEETGNIIYKDSYEYRIIVDKVRTGFKEYRCKDCGKIIRKAIPDNLKEENQYGSSIQGLALGLMNIGNVPINKVKRIISGLTMGEIELSEGYISKLSKRASKIVEPFLKEVQAKILELSKIHWDDTVIMINTKRSCMRFYGDERLALYKAHEKKNMEGLDKDNILNLLNKEQMVIHDHNKVNYNSKYDFMNVECNAHLLRDLQKVSDNIPERTWAKLLKEHIQNYNHKRNTYLEEGKEEFNEEEINEYFMKLDEYIILGYEENEQNNKPYYSQTEKNLLDRIVEYRDNYTYWVLDFGIPLTNNVSERALRGVKTKMKVSGQFQNLSSAEYYANIRSYIETCHRNGINELEALQRLASGNPFTLSEILNNQKN